ncbi:MAG: helix-turn-helix domain-containing protein [Nitrososphaera sp.]|nr:helix-turn-helix domain-containing protein [Nitrososphaera sp.]
MSGVYKITGRQLAAARQLAGMSQASLAVSASVSTGTVCRMEKSKGIVRGLTHNIQAIRAVLEARGIEFTSGGAFDVQTRVHQ